MLLPSFAACSSTQKAERSKDKPEGSSVGNEVEFPGEAFTVLCRENNSFGKYTYEIIPDDGATDSVNQAVYQRNRDVCDMFALSEIKAVAIPGDWGAKDDFINKFRNSVDAGLGEFDLVMSQVAYMAQGELLQYYYDFYEVPYVSESLDQDYYYSSFINEMTINGKLKYMVGDYSLTYYDHTFVMYFNKQLAEEYNLENVYDLVNSGEWTVDKFIEMASGKWKDDNSDDWPGVEDTFGYIIDIANVTDGWAASFDAQPTHFESGVLTIGYDVNKVQSILEKMVGFKKTNDCYSVRTSSDMSYEENPLDKIFREGRALFYPAILMKASDFRGMDIDFGIIPRPKWNTDQEKYLTSADVGYSAACIPTDVKNIEKSGAVFDTLTLLSNRDVVPTYYDQALKYKMTRDEDSAAMLDIIRDGFTLNFGFLYGQTLEQCADVYSRCFDQENLSFSSYHSSKVKAWQRNLDKLMTYFE